MNYLGINKWGRAYAIWAVVKLLKYLFFLPLLWFNLYSGSCTLEKFGIIVMIIEMLYKR